MKKAVALFLSVFYLLISTGFAINIHYCAGEITAVKLLDEQNSCCCGDRAKIKHCCDDETLFLQLDDNPILNPGLRLFPKQLYALTQKTTCVDASTYKTGKSIDITSLAIPPPKKQPVWLLNCSFTFYG